MASASATLSTIPASSHSSLSLNLSTPKSIELKLTNKNARNRTLQFSSYASRNSDHLNSIPENPSLTVADKLRLLVSEFKSLSEPIDRVRRLLHFAALLPPLEESDRVAENRSKPECSKSMASASENLSTIPTFSHSSLSINLSTPKSIELKLKNKNGRNRALQHYRNSDHLNSIPENPNLTVADKLRLLVSEFKSLSEPIDRVRRLLHFAALLPPLEESDRVADNRITGCTTQVWLVATMDHCGRMRFKADSDSEISKGFCWCLIWMLDGAEAEEVLMMKTEDLTDVHVGLHVKAQSRVNTWQNLLFSMQKATKALVINV